MWTGKICRENNGAGSAPCLSLMRLRMRRSCTCGRVLPCRGAARLRTSCRTEVASPKLHHRTTTVVPAPPSARGTGSARLSSSVCGRAPRRRVHLVLAISVTATVTFSSPVLHGTHERGRFGPVNVQKPPPQNIFGGSCGTSNLASRVGTAGPS